MKSQQTSFERGQLFSWLHQPCLTLTFGRPKSKSKMKSSLIWNDTKHNGHRFYRRNFYSGNYCATCCGTISEIYMQHSHSYLEWSGNHVKTSWSPLRIKYILYLQYYCFQFFNKRWNLFTKYGVSYNVPRYFAFVTIT